MLQITDITTFIVIIILRNKTFASAFSALCLEYSSLFVVPYPVRIGAIRLMHDFVIRYGDIQFGNPFTA
jgi:hypothetical protein